MNENDRIEIAGASENNVRSISLNIPKEKLIVLAGVSGSGKSSLAFDTIAVKSSRQWQASYPLYLRNLSFNSKGPVRSATAGERTSRMLPLQTLWQFCVRNAEDAATIRTP